MPAITVASFNIRNGRAFDGLDSWPLRRYSTARMIGALDADVLGLQEAYRCQLRWLMGRMEPAQSHGRGRNTRGSGEWTPIVTRPDRIRSVAERTLWFGAVPEQPGSRLPGAPFPRITTIVEAVHIPTQTSMLIANTHLDESSPSRREMSARQLAQWLDDDSPRMLMGDLNTTPDDQTVFGPLAEIGLRSALGPDETGTNHDFTGSTEGPRLDHILVSRHFGVAEATVVTSEGRLPSDHWPVRAVLHLDR